MSVWVMPPRTLANKQNKPQTKRKNFFLINLKSSIETWMYTFLHHPRHKMYSAEYHNNLEAYAETFEELEKVETAYEKYYADALVSPFNEGPEFWPEARSVFASFQGQIDALRMELGMPLLWFTEKEMKEMTKSPDEPRKPYKMPTAPHVPDEEEEQEEAPETVTVRGRTTITLDALIKQLEALRETLGDDAPVWHVEFGGTKETRGAEQWKGGVVIE
jgi:hypothetical protein